MKNLIRSFPRTKATTSAFSSVLTLILVVLYTRKYTPLIVFSEEPDPGLDGSEQLQLLHLQRLTHSRTLQGLRSQVRITVVFKGPVSRENNFHCNLPLMYCFSNTAWMPAFATAFAKLQSNVNYTLTRVV